MAHALVVRVRLEIAPVSNVVEILDILSHTGYSTREYFNRRCLKWVGGLHMYEV